MLTALHQALGAHAELRGGTLCAVPADERALAEVLQVLKDRGARLGRELHLSRARLAGIGTVEPRSMTVEAQAGVTLEALEQALRPKSLTLGALPPSAWTETLADFLEGPHAGLRAIPGGRLEPICARLEGMTSDGRVFVTQPGPRSAAGPDLTALFLGGRGRMGLVTKALVRAFRAPTHKSTATFRVQTARQATLILRRIVSDGAWLSRAVVGGTASGVAIECSWAGSEAGVERERELIERAFVDGGGTAARELTLTPSAGEEQALTWVEVEKAVVGDATLELHRVALPGVVARGAAPVEAPSTWQASRAVVEALDPFGALGGVP